MLQLKSAFYQYDKEGDYDFCSLKCSFLFFEEL